VGRKQPNELGIYDMSGKKWEWCNDWYSAEYYVKSPYENPQGPDIGTAAHYQGE
jgi:formylglycine-generating enzyme required for sulfatase activity